MDDLEMTKLCADAMGYEACPQHDSAGLLAFFKDDVARSYVEWFFFDPLEEDAQAMALMKKFQLSCGYNHGWGCVKNDADGMLLSGAYHFADLNRAIVECVAKLSQSTDKAKASA